MDHSQVKKIVDGHSQKYRLSCSPSIVELLLKLEGKVATDYFVLQDKYKDQNIGLDFARNQTLEGLQFKQHNLSTEGSFADRITSELAAGRFVGIYVKNSHGYHGWVVTEIDSKRNLILCSKPSELGNGEGKETIHDSVPLADCIPPRITDCVYYRHEQPDLDKSAAPVSDQPVHSSPHQKVEK